MDRRRYAARLVALCLLVSTRAGAQTSPRPAASATNDTIDEQASIAAQADENAGRLPEAIAARQALIDRSLSRGSPLAQRALYRLAQNLASLQDHEPAAAAYERYAAYVASHRDAAERAEADAVSQAADALRTAIVIRLALNDGARAFEDAAQFERTFGSDPVRQRIVARVVYAVGQWYVDRAEHAAGRLVRRAAWTDALRHYEHFAARFGHAGALDLQILGEVAIGRAHMSLAHETEARQHFEAASSLWGSTRDGAAPGETRIREALGDDSWEAVASARDAVAEARFHLADRSYRGFVERRLPVFHGPPTRQAYDAWARAQLLPFVVAQREALEHDATPAFASVMEMHVPRWEIAAAGRLAEMFREFGAYIRTADAPPDIVRSAELTVIYDRMRREAAERFDSIAATGFEACLRRAAETHWSDESSETCARGLRAIDPRRAPEVDEILPRGDGVASRPATPSPIYEPVSVER